MQIKNIIFEWDDSFPIFVSKQYLSASSSEYGWLGGYINNSLKFVLPFVIRKRLFFRWLQFQTETIYLDPELTTGQEKDFLESVVSFLSEKRLDFIAQPPTNAVFNTTPAQSVSTPFGTYRIDLTLTEEELWGQIHQKHKNVIRRAIKNSVEIVSSKDNADLAYELLKQTMLRSGMGVMGKAAFNDMIDSLGEYLEIFVACYNDSPQGCAIIPFSKFGAYYLYGGSIDQPLLGSMNLLQWHAIKHFKALGVKVYDFVGARIKPQEGSKLEGIQRFKSRFGSEMKHGYLWKVPLKPGKYELFKFLHYLKTKSPLDIIDQENGEILYD